MGRHPVLRPQYPQCDWAAVFVDSASDTSNTCRFQEQNPFGVQLQYHSNVLREIWNIMIGPSSSSETQKTDAIVE